MPHPASTGAPRRFGASFFARLVAWFILVPLIPVLLCVAWTYVASPAPGSAALFARLALALGILAGPVWLALHLARRRSKTGRPVASLAASLILLGSWLSADDAVIRHSADHPALRSDFPGAAATHALVLRHAKGAAGSLYDTSAASNATARWPALGKTAEERDKWLAFVSAHGAEIDAAWQKAEPMRAWFDEMSGQPELADLTEKFSDPTPGFTGLRQMTRVACAQATRLALDGHGDDALAVLGTTLDVGQKLQIHSRTLVRRMIAIVIQRQAFTAINLVLERAPTSTASRERLLEILATSQTPEDGARLLLLSEYYIQSREFAAIEPQAIAKSESHSIPALFNPLLRLGYNPRATVNALGDIYIADTELILRRDFSALDRLNQGMQHAHAAFYPHKNHIGHLLIAMALPAYAKVAKSYWELQDERIALQARLAQTAAVR